MSFYPKKRHLCLPRAVQMRIGGKFAERLDPGAGLLMHNTCAGCHRWTRFIIAAPLAGPCGPRKWTQRCPHLLLPPARVAPTHKLRRGCLASRLKKMVRRSVIKETMYILVGLGSMRVQRRKRGRLDGDWSHFHPLPPTPHSTLLGEKTLSCFQRIPFSRPHSPEDPGGPGPDRERQRVREEDQHRHREDLHPSCVQLLCRWCQRPRCLPGEIITHLTFDQISSLDIFQNL